MGTIASAAEKNSTGGATCARSRASETGMNTRSQFMEGCTLMTGPQTWPGRRTSD